MPAANEDAIANPNYATYYKSYATSKIDPSLANTLAAGGLDYKTWQSLDQGTQAQVQMLLGLGGSWGPAGGGNAGGQLFNGPQDIVPFLQNSGALSPAQVKSLATGGSAVAATGKAPAKGLVAQPHADATGGAGGGYSVPSIARQTGGQLATQLKSMGYHFPFDIAPMIQKAIQVSNGDASTSIAAFRSILYDSKQFKHYYPNYFAPNGSAKFDNPGDYDKQVLAYQSAAQRQGFKVDRTLAGTLIGHDVSADEFQQRTQIAATIKSNAQLFGAFNSIAASQGVKGIKTAQDAFAFLTGRSDPKSYQVWNAAAAKAAATGAGLQESNAAAMAATKSLTTAAGYQDIEKSYQDIAQQLKDSGAELGAFGLSQKDLETVQFGGANRAMLAARAQQALTQTQAQGQEVGTAMNVTATGVPVAAQQQQQAGE